MAQDDRNVTDTTTSVESVVGHPNGEDLGNGEVVVYDYDENDQFIGWHKGTNSN